MTLKFLRRKKKRADSDDVVKYIQASSVKKIDKPVVRSKSHQNLSNYNLQTPEETIPVVQPAPKVSWHSLGLPLEEDDDEEDNYWGSTFSPLRDDVHNPDPILRHRTIDSVNLARRRNREASAFEEEDIIQHKVSFSIPADARDDISMDAEHKYEEAPVGRQSSGVYKMMQTFLGDEDVRFGNDTIVTEWAVAEKEEIGVGTDKRKAIPLQLVVCHSDANAALVNEELNTKRNTRNAKKRAPNNKRSPKRTSSERGRMLKYLGEALDDDVSAISEATGLSTYDDFEDDSDPAMCEACDAAIMCVLKPVHVMKKLLY